MSSKRLFKLRTLVDELTNRDEKIKEDLSLFESVFESFPVPVAFWSVSPGGEVYSKKLSAGKNWNLIDKDCKEITGFYKCGDLQRALDFHWDRVGKGQPVSFMSMGGENQSVHVWHRLIPRIVEGELIGIIGLSWDVSTNHAMLVSLKEIESLSRDNTDTSKINDFAVKGIASSRLNKLMEDKEDG